MGTTNPMEVEIRDFRSLNQELDIQEYEEIINLKEIKVEHCPSKGVLKPNRTFRSAEKYHEMLREFRF